MSDGVYIAERNCNVRMLRTVLATLPVGSPGAYALEWAISRLAGMPENWVAVDEDEES